jgi:hypothetical protein
MKRSRLRSVSKSIFENSLVEIFSPVPDTINIIEIVILQTFKTLKINIPRELRFVQKEKKLTILGDPHIPREQNERLLDLYTLENIFYRQNCSMAW